MFASRAFHNVLWSQHSNVQVSIFVTCLNLAGTGSRLWQLYVAFVMTWYLAFTTSGRTAKAVRPVISGKHPVQRTSRNTNPELNFTPIAQDQLPLTRTAIRTLLPITHTNQLEQSSTVHYVNQRQRSIQVSYKPPLQHQLSSLHQRTPYPARVSPIRGCWAVGLFHKKKKTR